MERNALRMALAIALFCSNACTSPRTNAELPPGARLLTIDTEPVAGSALLPHSLPPNRRTIRVETTAGSLELPLELEHRSRRWRRPRLATFAE